MIMKMLKQAAEDKSNQIDLENKQKDLVNCQL